MSPPMKISSQESLERKSSVLIKINQWSAISLERFSREVSTNGAEQESSSRRSQIIIKYLSIKPIIKCRPLFIPYLKQGTLRPKYRNSFYCAAPHQPCTRGHSGKIEGRGRSNMAAANCARENILQDKDTRFVNITYYSMTTSFSPDSLNALKPYARSLIQLQFFGRQFFSFCPSWKCKTYFSACCF